VLERLRAGTPAGVTVSVGLALWDSHESAEELLARADRALYAAKTGGRDCLRTAA
jgi:GGDEF domain-containing protein